MKTTIPDDLGYTRGSTQKYWCHLCKIEFSKLKLENKEIQCNSCGKFFCEEINSQNVVNHPSRYVPFQATRRRDNNRLSGEPGFHPILDILTQISSMNEENHFNNILSYLIANDPNKYGNPPASKEEVEKLQRLTVTKNNQPEIQKLSSDNCCPVCKDEYQENDELIKLPCSHLFHNECILPWLKERNSCPTCRYELKTDDNDYEERKKEKKSSNTNQNQDNPRTS